MDQRSEKKNCGFTLIEVLIVVAILGILMSIAVPAYSEYIRRAHRAAAQQFLHDVAQRQEQYLLDNRQYATILGAGAGGLGMVVPADISPYYSDPDLTGVCNPLPDPCAATPPRFVIFMAPKAGTKMADDGRLAVNNTTQKWRDTSGRDATPPGYTYKPGTDKPW